MMRARVEFLRRAPLAPRKWLCNMVMLRLRVHYVSKPAIFGASAILSQPEIEVPIEFQGLGVASQRRFPCEFDSFKERFRGR